VNDTRPRLHFTVREGWINDPLGLTWHGGQYHLFYQFAPDHTGWRPEQRWGHATSPDLLHWAERPVALAPGDGDDGVWSGSVVVPEEGPAALFYTAVRLGNLDDGRVRIARPADATWDMWVKGGVVVEPPPELDLLMFRDPWVVRDGGAWRMVVGAAFTDGTAAALTYRSEDLEDWTYDGVLVSRHREEVGPVWTGAGWECPQLFRLGDDWVLTFSVWEPEEIHYEAYAVGALTDGRFTARSWGRLSWGPSPYAGSAFVDRDGARGLIYWLRGMTDPAGRWAGVHSLPHTLHLDGDRLVAVPHATLAARRIGGTRSVRRLPASPQWGPDGQADWGPDGQRAQLREGAAETGLQVDVVITLDPPPEQRDHVLGDRTPDPPPDQPECTLDVDDGALQLRVRGAELATTTPDGSWTMPLGGRVVRVVLDGPVVEIFAEHGTMALVVPCGSAGRSLHLAGAGRAEVWELG